MADYLAPTVVQQCIPLADMTPLERLLLENVFEARRDGDGLWFYANERPQDLFMLTQDALEAALAASRPFGDSTACTLAAEQRSSLPCGTAVVAFDISGTSWAFILQDIVKRSPTLRYVTVVCAHTCTRALPDGFGGEATLITADAIRSRSTYDILQGFLSEAGLEA